VVLTGSGLAFAWGLTTWAVGSILDLFEPPRALGLPFVPIVWLGVVWLAGRTVYRAATHPWLCATATTLCYAAGVSVGIEVDVHRHVPDAHHWPIIVPATATFALTASLLGAWAGRALVRAPTD
jgi:hypothetical protein